MRCIFGGKNYYIAIFSGGGFYYIAIFPPIQVRGEMAMGGMAL